MQISYLEEFSELVYCLNFTTAAKRLNITQSTLSKHISSLEKECGQKLFIKEGQKLRLSRAGQIMFQNAKTIINSHQEALEQLRHLRAIKEISICGLYSNPQIVKSLAESRSLFKDTGHEIELTYKAINDIDYIDQVKQNISNLAFTMTAQDHDSSLSSKLLFSDQWVAVVSENHPLSNKNRLLISDLDHQNMYNPTGSYLISGETIALQKIKACGARPILHPIYLNRIEDFPMLSLDNGLLIVERSIASQKRNLLPSSIRLIPFCDEEACFEYFAIHKECDETVRDFVKVLTRTIDQNIQAEKTRATLSCGQIENNNTCPQSSISCKIGMC